MAATLRVGMAGLGAGARQVLPSFKQVEGVELAAVADVRPGALDEFADRGVRTFTSVEAMCKSSDVDAVWIATPNVLHMEHALLAANNGKHVICEKPMALNLDQAQSMVDAVDKNAALAAWKRSNPERAAEWKRERADDPDR